MSHVLSYLKLEPQQQKPWLVACLLSLGYGVYAFSAYQVVGVLLALAGAALLPTLPKQARNYIGLVAIATLILTLTPIGTETDLVHLLLMTLGLAVTLLVPYAISHIHYKHSFIHFRLSLKKWPAQAWVMVLFAIVLTPIVLYAYFTTTDASEAWIMESVSDKIIVFTAIMLIGLWEEFFFVATVFGIYQKFMPVVWANIFQAVMFSGFLYQFGFTGWIVPLTIVYALYQAAVFHLHKNLLINVVIHVIVDIAVFFCLLASLG